MTPANAEWGRFCEGYSHRERGLTPDSASDAAYFRGYCERLMEEMRIEQLRAGSERARDPRSGFNAA